MTLDRRHEERAASASYRSTPAGVLAARMAAALVHHEPGWRLPRLTALARRYNVSPAEVDAAIDELAARHLVRRLPDGQVYRASPAEYWVPLEGLPGLSSHVDPMGGQLLCRSRSFSRRRPPEDIGRLLGLAPGELAIAVRCLWTVGGEPAALSASYLPDRPAAPAGEPPPLTGQDMVPAGNGDGPAAAGPTQPAGPREAAGAGETVLFPAGVAAGTTPRAVQLEMGLPAPSVARSLRMSAGEPVATLTVSFAGPAAGPVAALTTAMLRPELFRIVLAVPGPAAAGGDPPGARWPDAMSGW